MNLGKQSYRGKAKQSKKKQKKQYIQILTLFEGMVDIEQRKVVTINVGESHLGLVCSLLSLIRAHKALGYCSKNWETDPAPPQPRMTAGEGGYGPNIKPHPPHKAKGSAPPGLLNTLLQPPRGATPD